METTSTTNLRLTPSGRDFFVYERVMIDLASTRQVAEEAKISQTRVRQIVGRVLDWLAETLSAKSGLADEAQLLVARHIAADRLEALYRDANRKWCSTEQCKFANLALRIIAAKAKLPALPGRYAALMADVLDGPLPEASPIAPPTAEPATAPPNAVPSSIPSQPPKKSRPKSQPPSPVADQPPTAPAPPVGDCSPPAPIPSPAPQSTPPESPAIPSLAPASAPLPPAALSARRAFLAPAHSPNLTDDDTVTELKITPQTLGFTTKKHLSRRERRRLRALAAK